MASGKTVRFLLPPKTFPMSTPRRRVPEHCKCRFKCPTCEAVFSHYILLCVHTWSHAPGDLRVPDPAVKPCSILQSTENFGLQCFLCPLRFASHLALRQHLDASHTAAEDVKLLRFACAFCAMRYASADLLIAHIQQHDVWEDGDFYPLFAGVVGKPLCERDDTVTSFELDDLVKELQKIAGELPAQKQPVRKSALSIKSRSSMHTPLNYLCALCGMKFQHGYQIDEHVRMRHKGFLKLMKARHACVYCGTKFFKLSVLREHLLMHHAISVTPRKKNLVRV